MLCFSICLKERRRFASTSPWAGFTVLNWVKNYYQLHPLTSAPTLFNDLLSNKRFDFPFVNPPYGYEWSKDYDAVTTREPMQNNPRVRQRLGQRGLKPETLPPLLPSSFSRFTFQRGQLFSSTQIPVCLVEKLGIAEHYEHN